MSNDEKIYQGGISAEAIDDVDAFMEKLRHQNRGGKCTQPAFMEPAGGPTVAQVPIQETRSVNSGSKARRFVASKKRPIVGKEHKTEIREGIKQGFVDEPIYDALNPPPPGWRPPMPKGKRLGEIK